MAVNLMEDLGNEKRDLKEILDNRIVNTPQGKFTRTTDEMLLKETGLTKEELGNERGELLRNGMLFCFTEKNMKISYDGKINQIDGKTVYFNNKENFKEYINNVKEHEKNSKELANKRFFDKKNIAYSISDNAKKIFDKVNDLTFKAEPKKGYIDLKELRKAVDLDYKTFNETLNELRDKKALYALNVHKVEDKNGEKFLDSKNIITSNLEVVRATIKRENTKNEIYKLQGIELGKLPKLEQEKTQEQQQTQSNSWQQKLENEKSKSMGIAD